MKFQALIKVACREGEVDVLRDLLEDRDLGLVMDIPLSGMAESDGWGWPQELSGTYSVALAV